MKRSFVILNVMAPLIVGAVIYYVFFEETIFVRLIDDIFGLGCHVSLNLENVFVRLIRFYLLDFLWAYAMMSFVLWSFGTDRKIVIGIVLFEILMEMIQLFPFVKGTFDVCDIGMEIAADILVILLFRRRLKNEKD